ncbi:phosphoribosyltransferase family protein [Cryptosporangium aurantiacum]|uniref:phosphoribosyltransferase family protein n=1 Tax=Cryptosporangium aurantiacum TaxID=134849 RepID=UPI0015BEE04C|nr:phosphoribosyltransferase family protein [Cryptosporangium aurantiacum]
MSSVPLSVGRSEGSVTPADPDLRERLLTAFRWIDPGEWCDHLLTDRSGWWRDPVILDRIGPALAALSPAQPTVVVAPATSGFLLGPLVARAAGVGFVEAYRDLSGAELADDLITRSSGPGHDGRPVVLGVRSRHLGSDDSVLVVDDWVETGAQLSALAEIISAAGARYLGAAVIVDGAQLPVRDRLGVRGLVREVELDHRRRS